MIDQITYLNEVKFRNQVRKDLDKVVAVANKANEFRKGVAHVRSKSSEPDWFVVSFYGYGAPNDTTTLVRIAQTLHACGYEIKFVQERKMFGEGMDTITLYRKRA